MSYQAVLFDMDGVIVDSEQLHFAAFRAVLRNYECELTNAEYERHFGGRTDAAGFERYFSFIGKAVDLPTILHEKATIYAELAAHHLTPYPGASELIQHLVKRKIPLALVTGSLRSEADITLMALGLIDTFSATITAEDIAHSKPNPEGYLKGAKALGIEPKQCIVIEDTPVGVQAARAAGMRCVAVTNTHTQEELLGATHVLTQLEPGCIDSL